MAQLHRKLALERAKDRCEYCQMPQEFDVRPFQIDHIRAEKHRGTSAVANLAWSCLPCNAYKGPNIAGYDPTTQLLQRLYNPRIDSWSEHFAWEGALLVGKTSIGRTTIEVLRINAQDRIVHRQFLFDAKCFPP